MKQRIFRWSLVFLAMGAALAIVFAAAANNLEEEGDAVGYQAFTGSANQEGTARGYAEGTGYSSVGSHVSEPEMARGIVEGQAGEAGQASFPTGDAWTALAVPANLTEVYRFAGVTDDGQQGSALRKIATSVLCTNLSAAYNQIEVRVYQWNGTDVFTGTLNMPPNRTVTFSTQNTAVYFEDVYLGGFPGTSTVNQGSGVVLAQSSQVICSAQMLDPFNNPPTFAVGLEVYKR